MKKPKADYTYIINRELNRIEIVDLNQGNRSVTNDAEDVLTAIREEVGDEIEELQIVYCDSMEIWDTIIPTWENKICVSVEFKSGI